MAFSSPLASESGGSPPYTNSPEQPRVASPVQKKLHMLEAIDELDDDAQGTPTAERTAPAPAYSPASTSTALQSELHQLRAQLRRSELGLNQAGAMLEAMEAHVGSQQRETAAAWRQLEDQREHACRRAEAAEAAVDQCRRELATAEAEHEEAVDHLQSQLTAERAKVASLTALLQAMSEELKEAQDALRMEAAAVARRQAVDSEQARNKAEAKAVAGAATGLEELSQREQTRIAALLCRPSFVAQLTRSAGVLSAAESPDSISPPRSRLLTQWASGGAAGERATSPMGSYSPRSERKPTNRGKRSAWVPAGGRK